MNLPDVYQHPMFNKDIDRLTGFRTRSMLCMAVSDMTGKNVAVLQVRAAGSWRGEGASARARACVCACQSKHSQQETTSK